MKGGLSRIVLVTGTALTFAFLLLPLLVIAASSLDGEATAFIRFPPRDLSLKWYGAIAAKYWHALALSFVLGLTSLALVFAVGATAKCAGSTADLVAVMARTQADRADEADRPRQV